MALAKSLLKSVARRASVDPGKILTRANTEIAWDNAESLFVTAFAGMLDVESGAFAYSNAGHEPPILRRANGDFERFEYAGGPPLCIVEDLEYATEHRTLAPGEWLCVVTDGVTEAMNLRDELYGEERLLALLAAVRESASPAAIVTAIREDVRRHAGSASQSDDITVLCVRWVGPSSPPAVAE
jgi:serine phosphatase RsbU (regulator of sigma subunit)